MRSVIATLPLTCEADVVLARQRARLIANCLGFGRQDQNVIATAVLEIAGNAVEHAGGGTLELAVARNGEGEKLEIRISDTGPGIRDIDLVLSAEERSPGEMRLGIAGARRLVDGFHVETASGHGTVVTLCKNLPASAPLHTGASIRRIADEIAKEDLATPLQELRRQSRELLLALSQLRQREDELAQLNKELEDTNSGVMALYAELDDRAERLRVALQNNELLLGELRHRTKNSMAVIQSIARQTLRDAPGSLVAAFTRRIQALAAAYDSLSQKDWLGANLEDLARRQLVVVEGRFTLSGPSVTVPPALAMSLSLVLHELLTNATKYGALSVPPGHVELSWELAGDTDQKRVLLNWQERGGPRVTPPNRAGFGSTFIERGLPGASVKRRFEPEGVICTIDLPLS
jgi:two-component sensor histidine kinase